MDVGQAASSEHYASGQTPGTAEGTNLGVVQGSRVVRARWSYRRCVDRAQQRSVVVVIGRVETVDRGSLRWSTLILRVD